MVEIWRIELLKIDLKQVLSYKEELLSNIVEYSILIFISYFVWSAFNSGENVLAYITVVYAMISFSYYRIIKYIFSAYRNGTIIFNLIRPVRLVKIVFWSWISKSIRKVVPVALLLIAIALNPNVYFIASTFFALYIMFLIGYIVATIAYESYFEWGVGNLLRVLAYFTGGGIPIFLMPDFVKKLIMLSPFFYATTAPWMAARDLNIVFIQIALIVVLTIIAFITESKMMEKFTVVGV